MSPNSSRNDLENWWKVFETFYADNEDLQDVRRKLIASQKLLDDQKKEITEKTEEIQQDIDLALRDPPIDLGWGMLCRLKFFVCNQRAISENQIILLKKKFFSSATFFYTTQVEWFYRRALQQHG